MEKPHVTSPAQNGPAPQAKGLLTGFQPGAEESLNCPKYPAPKGGGRRLVLRDGMTVKELAAAMDCRVFRITVDLMELDAFTAPHQAISLELAGAIARKYGYEPETAS